MIGPVEEVTKQARHLLVVPSGPPTSLPFHLLVTEKAATAIPLKDIGSYRDAAWLIKRQAVSILPVLASLKALRQVARRDPGARPPPLVGFADPVFDPAERAKALAERRAAQTRVAVTRVYGEFWQGAGIGRNSPAICRRCSTRPTNSRRWAGSSVRRPSTSTFAATPAKLW
jgi:hypothetical protein